MPALASPSTWRTHPHRTEGYLAVYVADTIFSCSVNQSSFDNPETEFEYDGVTVGAYTDVLVGMTVKISSSAGAFKGYARVRAVPDSDTLYIGAVPSGEIAFDDDDLIEVLEDYRIWNIIPRIDVEYPDTLDFYKDYLDAYVDQNEEQPPVANTGPHFADLVDDSGYVYVSWDLTDLCYPVADGASITTYSADLGDGMVTSGSIASGIFTARFPAGKRFVLITVTDDNGKSHTAKMCVIANEKTGSNAPVRARLRSLTSTLVDGATAEFDLLVDDASSVAIPEQALVIYYEKEVYGTAQGSLAGFSGREHVKFVGWVTQNGVSINPETSDVSISCVGPLGAAARIASFNGKIDDSDSPSDWYEIKNLTLFKLVYYLIKWHSTILDVCDLEEPDWADSTPYYRFTVGEGTLASGLNTIANWYNAALTCDRQGTMYIRRDQVMMSDSDRTGVATIVTLEDHDWDNVSVIERNWKQVYWTRASGLLASRTDVTPYLSIAPGRSPGQGAISDPLNNQLVSGQTELNVRSGRHYGRRNSKYENITIAVWPGGLIADPALREYIAFDLDAGSNRRGIAFSSTKFILHEVRYQFDPGTGTGMESWVMEMETSGEPGETLPIPEGRHDDFTFAGFPPFRPYDDYDPRPDINVEFANAPAFYVCTPREIARTRNHTATTPNWEVVLEASDFTAVFSGVSVFRNFKLDPWNPKMSAYVTMTSSAGGGSGQWALFYVENLDGIPGTQIITALVSYDNSNEDGWWNYGFPALACSINIDGAVWVAKSGYYPNKTQIHYRLSRTSSFAKSTIASTQEFGYYPQIAVGLHKPGGGSGKVYVHNYDSLDTRNAVFLDTGLGVSWANPGDKLSNTDVGRGAALHVPYESNPNDNIVYLAADAGLARRNEDTSWDDITPDISGSPHYPQNSEHCIHSYVGDRLKMCLVTFDASILTSEDGGDNWVSRNMPGGYGGDLFGTFGWGSDEDIMATVVPTGASKGLWMTDDLFSAGPSSVTWSNQIGDWSTSIGWNGSGNFDPIACVPVWVA